jgi:hypothetical protein
MQNNKVREESYWIESLAPFTAGLNSIEDLKEHAKLLAKQIVEEIKKSNP